MRDLPSRIRIGTRGSALARWQAEHVARALRRIPGAPETETVLIQTEGDVIQDVPLSKVQGKAFFTKEIEEALLRSRVDVAVHSLKDLATLLPPGLILGAVMEREDPRDALILPPGREAGGEDLPLGARVGTSSLRRRALLARWRPDLEIADLRGNVPTRIRKLDEGRYDAVVLAAAGVKRLGLASRISAFLPVEAFLPAVSQGAVGIQIRGEDLDVAAWVGALDHPATRSATSAERALLRTLEGGCQVPVGAFAQIQEDRLHLRGVVCSLDGSNAVEGEISGPPGEADALGATLAQELLEKGARGILAEIRGDRGV